MLYLALILLFLAAALCLGFSRTVSTRRLGFLAAGATLAATATLSVEWLRGPVFDLPALTWLTWEDVIVSLSPRLGGSDLVLATTLLYGGALALLALALTLAPAVRGFGSLFAMALLTLAAALVGLMSSPLLLPFAWSLAVLLGYSTAWSSGALNRSEGMPQGLTLGLLASVLLLGGILAVEPILNVNRPVPALAAAGIVLACIILVGGAPFHNALEEAVTAPAALGALLHGLVFPILALTTLLRVVPLFQELLPPVWRVVLVVLGTLSWVVCSAGALREHGLRRLLGWQASAQAGLVILAIGLAGPLATLAVPALIFNLALTTLAGSLAATALERLTGSDDFTQTAARVDLRVPGMLWGIAALSALGLPPMWGFWGRYWLLEGARADMPWVVPLVLATSVLAMLVYLGPLARLLRRDFGERVVLRDDGSPLPLSPTGPGYLVVAVLVFAPLLGAGLVPQLAWDSWLRAMPDGPATLPVSSAARVVSVVSGVLGTLLVLLMLRYRSARRTLSDEDMTAVILAPDALAQSLSPLAWLGRPDGLMRHIWHGAQWLGRGVALLLAPFEQRFYLAAVLLAVISVILLMAL